MILLKWSKQVYLPLLSLFVNEIPTLPDRSIAYFESEPLSTLPKATLKAHVILLLVKQPLLIALSVLLCLGLLQFSISDMSFGFFYAYSLTAFSGFMLSWWLSLRLGLFISALVGLSITLAIILEINIESIFLLALFIILLVGSLNTKITFSNIGVYLGGSVIGLVLSLLVFILGYYLGIFLFTIHFFQDVLGQVSEQNYILNSIFILAFLSLLLPKFKIIHVIFIVFLYALFIILFFQAGVYLDQFPKDDLWRRSISGLSFGMLHALEAGLIFMLAYRPAYQLGGYWSGLLAGLFMLIVILCYLSESYFSNYPVWFGVILAVVSLTLLMTLPRLLATLIYPFEMAWNLGVKQYCLAYPQHLSKGLFYHSAFWHQRQFLPFYDLQTWLSTLLKQNQGLEGLVEQALLALNQDRQAKLIHAVQQVGVEQRLLACQNIEAIANLSWLQVSDLAEWQIYKRCSLDMKAALAYQQQHEYQRALKQIEACLEGALMQSTTLTACENTAILRLWKNMVTQEIARLQQQIQLVNPYRSGNIVNLGNPVFVVRYQLSQQIEQWVNQVDGSSFFLYGQRRMGKSSVLLNLPRLLSQTHCLVYIDMQLVATYDLSAFFMHICQQIQKTLKKQGIDTLIPNLSILENNTFFHMNTWFFDLMDTLPDWQFLFAIDECYQLERCFSEYHNLEKEPLLSWFRHLIQHHHQCRFLFSDAYALDDFPGWDSYFVNVLNIKLDYLSETESRQLISQPIPEFMMIYEPNTVAYIQKLTSGHPYLIQLLCEKLVDNYKQESVPVSINHVKQILLSLRSAGDTSIQIMLTHRFTDLDKLIMRYVALTDEGCDFARIRAYFSQYTFEQLEQALSHLLELDLFYKDKQAIYDFQIRLLRLWFHREH